MEANTKRKDIIKNITIIFLIIMLVLTFFSSTIMNRSLPQVAAQYAYSGQITTSVRANGTTMANENYQVILEEGRVIHAVNVRRGDKVQEGDLLFTLEEGDSTELQNAQDALTKAERDYEKWKLQSQTTIADAEREIRYKTEDLAKIKSRGIMSVTDTGDQEKAIKELEKKIASYQRGLALFELEDAERIMNNAQSAMNAAKNKMKAAEDSYKAAGDDYEEKTEAYNDLRGSMTSNSTEQLRQQLLSADRSIEDQTIELNRLQNSYDELQANLNALIATRTELEQALKTAESIYANTQGYTYIIRNNIASYQSEVEFLSSLEELTDDQRTALNNARSKLIYNQNLLSIQTAEESEALSDLNTAKSEYNAIENAVKQAEDQLSSMKQTLEDKTRTLNRAKSDRDMIEEKIRLMESQPSEQEQNAALDQAKAQMKQAEDNRDDAQDAYTESQTNYNTAKADYDSAKADYEAAKSVYESKKKSAAAPDSSYTAAQLQTMLENAETELEIAREVLDELKNAGSTNSDGYANYNAYMEAITAQQRTIENMKNELSRTREELALEEPVYKEAIERAKQTVGRIAETSGSNEIYAKVSGTINNISVSAGQEIKAQTVLAEIEQTDRGYTVELSMTAEQAKRVAVGQTASILYYWGTTPDAVVESIKPSQSDPQNTRIVTLLLTGDITAGQSFTFSLGERSANYDNVVPSSAIREDSNGKFVLIVEAKNTPIGNRYTAVRRDVEIIAEDDTNTAVSGLTGGEFVITTSQTPISAGQQVRLSDT